MVPALRHLPKCTSRNVHQLKSHINTQKLGFFSRAQQFILSFHLAQIPIELGYLYLLYHYRFIVSKTLEPFRDQIVFFPYTGCGT